MIRLECVIELYINSLSIEATAKIFNANLMEQSFREIVYFSTFTRNIFVKILIFSTLTGWNYLEAPSDRDVYKSPYYRHE